MRAAGLCAIWLVAPTTPPERIARITARASGFLYYVSREGVTGMQDKVSDTIAAMTAQIRAHTDLPVAVGFGISNAEQARQVARHADAIVVGSAVVNQIATLGARAGPGGARGALCPHPGRGGAQCLRETGSGAALLPPQG